MKQAEREQAERQAAIESCMEEVKNWLGARVRLAQSLVKSTDWKTLSLVERETSVDLVRTIVATSSMIAVEVAKIDLDISRLRSSIGRAKAERERLKH